MLQGIINGKSAITGKCFVNSATYAEGVIGTHLSLNLFKLGDQKYQKSIIIIPGYEYTINFFDAESGGRKTLTGLVMEVFGDDKTNQYILFKYKESKDNKKQILVGDCGCILNNPSGAYDDHPVKSIPTQNIFDIQYGPNSPFQQPCECEDESDCCCKGGWTTVLLGIDATVIKAVTINLKLLDDQCDNAVKLIEMKQNGIYEIAYCKPGTSTVYEFTGRLTAIEPLDDQIVGENTGIVHCNCHNSNENVGIAGSIYTSSGYHCDYDHFMTDAGPWTDVKLTFDTSELADGDLEYINLSWIRGINDVTPEDNPDPAPDDNNCNCDCCANNILAKGVVYFTDEEGKSLKFYPLTGKMVTVTVDGTETEIENYNEIFNSILNPSPINPDDEEDPSNPSVGEGEVIPGPEDW